jgi:hypothetical protein
VFLLATRFGFEDSTIDHVDAVEGAKGLVLSKESGVGGEGAGGGVGEACDAGDAERCVLHLLRCTSRIRYQTVRRKVNELVKRGWIARDGTGYLSVTPQAAQDLKEETEASISYLAALRSTLME